MKHHDDISAVAERLDVAGLLVGAVAGVVGMRDHHEIERRGERGGPIAAAVVDQDDGVDNAGGMPASVVSNVLAALYAGITTTVRDNSIEP